MEGYKATVLADEESFKCTTDFCGILMINPEVYSACTKVLTYTLTPEYKNIQILLQTGQDKINETC